MKKMACTSLVVARNGITGQYWIFDLNRDPFTAKAVVGSEDAVWDTLQGLGVEWDGDVYGFSELPNPGERLVR